MAKRTTLVSSDRSNVGCRRAINQDSRAIIAPTGSEEYRTRGWLFIVADGMGAHAAGEEASRMAVERVPAIYRKLSHRTPPDALLRALQQANAEIHDKGETDLSMKGMGTTCTTLVLVPRGALIGHVGDSRAYRIRGRTVEQLSKDHSWAWECGSGGKEADDIPKNIITRSMGPHPEVKPDIEGPFPVHDGDIFLLCSDGLSGQVSDAEIGLVTSHLDDPSRAAEALIGLTLARGAPDNVTVVIAKAGPKEVTKVFAKHEPWPLTDAGTAAPRGKQPAWWSLAAAAACVFVAMLISPWSDLVQNGSGFVKEASRIGAVTAIVAGVVFLSYTILSVVNQEKHPTSQTRGTKGGRGPHRKADCTPTLPLLEGIARSIDAASRDLGSEDADRLRQLVATARERAAARGFEEAVAAAGDALVILAEAIPRRVAARHPDESQADPDRSAGVG
ncbi:MAG: PP2C family protein-serine/threonine phosphatase [Planctomycetia bacterium]